MDSSAQTAEIQQHAHLLGEGGRGDYGALLDAIGDAQFVLIGEASHGTHEFYDVRAEITKLLTQEKGFNAVAVEADWPDAYCVNRYVRGLGTDLDADGALGGFRRFPTWMWRNTVMTDFVEWLRNYNSQKERYVEKAGFYGIDLYSLHGSIEAVLSYLDKVDPEAASRARYRYSCFDHAGDDPQAYGYAANYGLAPSCQEEVVKQLRELQQKAIEYMSRDGHVAEDDYFYTEQNARLVKNAEEYYRTMFEGQVSSWNLRDKHMTDTIGALAAHFKHQRSAAKVVVWAHNSHLGDARATDAALQKEWNVGQLMRERYGKSVFNIGFSTHSGTVTAATDWGADPERKRVRASMKGSHELLLHEAGIANFYLVFADDADLAKMMREERLERAIGVIYRPQSERLSHYFHARMSDQFDAVIHLDETNALEPLEREALWDAGELPETYPTGV